LFQSITKKVEKQFYFNLYTTSVLVLVANFVNSESTTPIIDFVSKKAEEKQLFPSLEELT